MRVMWVADADLLVEGMIIDFDLAVRTEIVRQQHHRYCHMHQFINLKLIIYISVGNTLYENCGGLTV